MAWQADAADVAGVLETLIRFEGHYDTIVRQLMDTLDDDLPAPDRPPTLRAEDVAHLCDRVQSHDLSPAELQKWARVVKGLTVIAVESQRVYAIVTELATGSVTANRYAEIRLALAA
jgi:hypothetical protein